MSSCLFDKERKQKPFFDNFREKSTPVTQLIFLVVDLIKTDLVYTATLKQIVKNKTLLSGWIQNSM